jgi:LytS/YehU family sensor histidine kinase
MEVKKSQQALQKTLLKVKKRLKQFEGRKGLSIHFLRNLSIILGAKNKIYKAADAKIVMEHLTELINYVFEHQGDDARLVHWREEFAQVKALRFILESIEGDQVLNIVDFDRAFNSMVVPFSFLTIIENAYLHGYKGTKEPIEVTLEKNEHSLRFKCVNSMNPSYIFKHRQETGLASLDQLLLKAHGVHYKLDTIKEDNQYYVMLEVNDPV